MPQYMLSVETTSNNTAGAADSNTAVQMLMGSGKDAQLIAVGIFQKASAAGENSGRWVIDRISALGTASTLVPKLMDPRSPASAITSTTATISTTLVGSNTHVSANDAILELNDGWNYFDRPGDPTVFCGASQGFALRRATAPTGARVCVVCMIWAEV